MHPPSTSRARRRTAKGQAYDEEQAQMNNGSIDPGRKQGRQNIENIAVVKNSVFGNGGSAAQPAQEFAFQTLDNNRTSQKTKNRIRLTAKPDGIPRAPSAAPASKIGSQRIPTPGSTPTLTRRLSVQAAEHLASLRNPYVSPTGLSIGQSMRDRGMVTQTSQAHSIISPAAYAGGSQAAALRNLTMPMTTVPVHAQQPSAPPASFSSQPSQSTFAVNINHTEEQDEDSFLPRPRLHRLRRHPVLSFDSDREDEDQDHHPQSQLSQVHVRSTCDSSVHLRHGPTFQPEPEPSTSSVQLAPPSSVNTYAPTELDGLYSFDDALQDPLEWETPSRRRPRSLSDSSDQNLPPSQRQRFETDIDGQGIGYGSSVAALSQSPAEPTPLYDLSASHADTTLINMSTTGPMTRKGDCDASLQEILNDASILFKCRMSTEDAYPDILQARTWAKAALTQAAIQHGVIISPDASITRLVTRYSWHLRSEIGKEARIAVKSAKFAFNPAMNEEAVRHNQARAQYLLASRTYAYQDPDQRDGLYEAGAIQEIINSVYYKNRNDDGVIHDNIYRPFPFVGLALILTAIHCAVDEWATGTHIKHDFSESKYKAIYTTMLRDLRAFEAASKEDKILTQICSAFSESGRVHAKAPINPTESVAGTIGQSETDRAIAAWRAKRAGPSTSGALMAAAPVAATNGSQVQEFDA